MAINLTIRWSHPSANSAFVRYARVDNNSNPTYVVVSPNPVVTPSVTALTVATNVPNGQYIIEATPIYSDGRNCAVETRYTPACDGLISISAYINLGNVIVNWSAFGYVPKGRITINWPSGGQFVQNFNNINPPNNTTTVPIPPGNIGAITVLGQAVCDENSGFYSPYSNQVSLTNGGGTNPITGNFVAGNNINTLCDGSAMVLYTNGPFAIGGILYQDNALSTPFTGYTYVAGTGGGFIYTISTLTGEILTSTAQSCNVNIVNQVSTNNFRINSVSNIPGFTLGSPVLPSTQYVGTRTPAPFTDTIEVNVTSDIGASGKLVLLKDMVQVDCQNISSGNGTYTFASTAFNGANSISIYAQTGTC